MRKNNSNIAKLLKKSFEKRWCVRINTNHPDGDSYDIVVLHIGKHVVIGREFRDFVADGLLVFPKNVITSIRDSELEICENAILKKSGEIKHAKRIRWLEKVDSAKDIATVLARRNIWPAIETVEKRNAYLYVGPIFHVGDDEVEIYCYDAAGNWEGSYSLDYRRVFRLEFDSKYLQHFNDYMMQGDKPGGPVGFDLR